MTTRNKIASKGNEPAQMHIYLSAKDLVVINRMAKRDRMSRSRWVLLAALQVARTGGITKGGKEA